MLLKYWLGHIPRVELNAPGYGSSRKGVVKMVVDNTGGVTGGERKGRAQSRPAKSNVRQNRSNTMRLGKQNILVCFPRSCRRNRDTSLPWKRAGFLLWRIR